MSKISNENHHKDSCKYSIDIAKQFITLASGGIAFVVGIAISSNKDLPYLFYLVTGAFILSVGFGLIYVLSTIAHINKNQVYDVYSPQLKFFAAAQIIIFLVGIFLLVYVVLWKIENKVEKQYTESENIEIQLTNKKIIYRNLKETNTELNVSTDDKIEFKTHSSK